MDRSNAQAAPKRSVCISRVKAALPDLLSRVERGEEIQIIRHGLPVARLVPEPAIERAQLQTQIAEMRSPKGTSIGRRPGCARLDRTFFFACTRFQWTKNTISGRSLLHISY